MMRVLLSLLVLAFTVHAAQAGAIKPREGWAVIDTKHRFDALSDRLEGAVKAEKMGLVTSASASVGAKALGVTIPGNRVVGVYRNDFAQRMLKASVAAGIEAPIRFYVTENPDGATLAYRKPSAVFAPYFDEGGDALKKLAAELDDIFAAIARRATAN